MLFSFQLTVKGRLQAETQQEATAKVRAGLCLSLPLHEAIDDLVINMKSENDDLQEMQRRFK